MSRAILPPRTEPVTDSDNNATVNWLAFFDSLADGDTGTVWTPTFTGLTEVGTATKTGKYWRLSKQIAYARIVVTPSTSTTAVLGTTYCDNFPLNITSAGVVATLSDYTANVSGATSSPKRIYTSAWAALATPVTIIALLEVS